MRTVLVELKVKIFLAVPDSVESRKANTLVFNMPLMRGLAKTYR